MNHDQHPASEPTLRGERVTLRRTSSADLPRLLEILREPAVARHWSAPDPERDRAELLQGEAPGAGGSSMSFVIELAGEVAGWIQFWEQPHPDYRHAGIDLFVSTAQQGQGLGPEAIRLLCRYLFEVREHHRITIDPAAANSAAIRAYRKVGFRPVGILRQYERGADGRYHDGMLLELLAGELA